MAHLPWNKIETVLLDMDGTLLDLHFDTYFWFEHVPQTLAKRENKPLAECQAFMRQACKEVEGKLEWYCLDYWGERLDLNMMELKREIEHLISFRPDTIPFLEALKNSDKRVVLLTNAHPENLSLKIEKTKLDAYINTLISTHQFGVVKESQDLWKQLHNHLGFNPQTCLFVDDSQRILDAAKTFGIAYTLGITNPDSKSPENIIEGHPSINSYLPLLDEI